MIDYLDASVLLRVLLGQPNRLADWPDIQLGVGSALVEVECLRALDRLRLREGLTPVELVARASGLTVIDPDAIADSALSHPLPSLVTSPILGRA